MAISSMAIGLYLRNAFTRLRQRNRNDFAVRMLVLSSQALDRLHLLAFTLDRHADQGKGLGPDLESAKALRDEMAQRFAELGDKLSEMQAVAQQHRKG